MKRYCWMLMLGMACAVSAGDLTPGPIYYEEKTTPPPVTETGFAAWRPDPSAAMPPDGTAARWSVTGQTLDWQPSPDPARGGDAARIPDAILTDDGSALILLETVGTAPGPWATRLLVFSVAAKRFVNLIRFEDRRFTALAELSGDRLLLIAMDEKNTHLATVAMPAGQIVAENTGLPPASGFAVLDDRLWIKEKNTAAVRLLDTVTLQESAEPIAANHPGGALTVSRDGSVLLNYSPDPVFYTVIGKPDTPLPPEARPAHALPLDDAAQTVLLYAENAPAGLLIDGRFHPIAERAGGTAARRGETVFLGLQRRQSIALLQDPPIRGAGLQNPTAECRPVTRGEPFRIFCDPAEAQAVFVLDHRANFYRMKPPQRGRRWIKELLFTR